MATLFRVFNYLEGVAPQDAGGVFFIPPQGAGRIDNPDLYRVFYVADHPAAAVAETFGARAERWSAATLRGDARIPESVRALATFTCDELMLCDLDDPKELVRRKLRPSGVLTRDYTVTQGWAREIFQENRFQGIRWWSYYEAHWSSIGLWSYDMLTVKKIVPFLGVHPIATRKVQFTATTQR